MSVSDTKLIDLVKMFPNLWNKENKDYKDRICAENSWTYISKKLSVPVKDCQQRWQALRNRFSKVRAERERQPSGSAGGEKSEWSLFKNMQFLNQSMKRRKTFENYLEQPQRPRQEETPKLKPQQPLVEHCPEQQPFNLSSNYLEDVEVVVEEEEVPEFIVHENELQFECEDSSSLEQSRPSSRESRGRSTTPKECMRDVSEIVNVFQEYVSKQNTIGNENASIKNFVLSLVDDLTTLNPHLLRKCKLEIMNVVDEYCSKNKE